MALSSILRTKLIPPPRNLRTMPRPRVMDALKQSLDYRLTILQAGAGYGKSTALAELAGQVRLVWYQLNDEDNDPLVFLLHLFHAAQLGLTMHVGQPVNQLEAWDGAQGILPWRGILDQFINAISDLAADPILFIFDDAHLVLEGGEIPHILDRLIGRSPSHAHFLLSGRPDLSLPNLSRWRSKGEVLLLDQQVLTFTAQEIAHLFSNQYRLDLTSEEVDALLSYTEGWAIALQLIWQSIRSQTGSALEFPVHWQAESLDALFEVLTHEVFSGHPADIREFLLITSTLRELDPDACDALRRAMGNTANDSASMLAYLRRQDLFVVETAEGLLRYHHIFHNFLQQQAEPSQWAQWNRAAAEYYLLRQIPEYALHHLYEARAWDKMADLLDTYSPVLLSGGRFDTLASHISSLPPLTLNQHPMLLFTLGELARLHSRFDEAQGWYRQAEMVWRQRSQLDGIARSLRGQSRVYLDTVNPSQAEKLLEEAIRLTDGFEDREAQVRLFELLAENKLNSGQAAEAERLRQRAEELRLEGPSNAQLKFRVWLRTGRLREARRGLEEQAETEKRNPVQMPRAHRETFLLLSLIYAFQGQGGEAYQAALEGTRRGNELKSPFVTAVGHMRQGHALMLADVPDYENARRQFEKTIEISQAVNVPRLLVEANWGLCRVSGYQGDLSQAQSHAQQGIEIAGQAGDEWIASLTRLTMGASLMLASRYEAAEEWLARAVLGFQECSDHFGLTAAQLWLCHGWRKQKMFERIERVLPQVLAECREGEYGSLFTSSSYLGAPDVRIFTPLLVLARDRGWEAVYAQRLLESLGLVGVQNHPGFRLTVETLGGFQVSRGNEDIPPNGWRRDKARQLFQLLLTHRKSPLDRDQICEFLWPEADQATAQRNFKITLNTLYQVLEPDRDPGSDSAFIVRDGTTYTLRPHADLWLDADQFVRAAREGLRSVPAHLQSLEQAVAMYHGDYLPDALYETWASEERRQLSVMFFEAADKLASLYLQAQRYPEAIDLSQRVLLRDNCSERAYRHMMTAYNGLGDRGQLARTYQRCLQTLKDELDVMPSQETQDLYKILIRT